MSPGASTGDAAFCYFDKDHEILIALPNRFGSSRPLRGWLHVGFRQIDSKWGIDSLIESVRSMHFNASGSQRTYWDFYVGSGLFVTVLLLFAAVVAWQLGSLPAPMLASMRTIA